MPEDLASSIDIIGEASLDAAAAAYPTKGGHNRTEASFVVLSQVGDDDNTLDLQRVSTGTAALLAHPITESKDTNKVVVEIKDIIDYN